jgi:hypothetical protein
VTRHPRLASRTVVLAFALLAVACGGGSSEPTSSEAPLETSSTMAPGPTVPRPDQSGGGRLNVALPAGGPIDNVVPPGTNAYRLLTSGNCDQLLREIETTWVGRVDNSEFYLYRGAARACKGLWDGARADRNALGRPSYGNSCPEDPEAEDECPRCRTAVLRWLDSVLAARAKDPSYSPVFVPASRSASVCPTGTTTTDPPTTPDNDTGNTSTTEPTTEEPAP